MKCTHYLENIIERIKDYRETIKTAGDYGAEYKSLIRKFLNDEVSWRKEMELEHKNCKGE